MTEKLPTRVKFWIVLGNVGLLLIFVDFFMVAYRGQPTGIAYVGILLFLMAWFLGIQPYKYRNSH